MGVEGSPFVVAGPAQPGDLIGRQDILATLWDRAVRGRFVLLVAPRRFGKTTLVHRLEHDASKTKELDVVIIDLLGVQTLNDVALRMAQAWARLPRGLLAKTAATVLPYIAGLNLSGGVVSLQLRAPDQTPGSTLEGVLDIPRQVTERTGRRALVVLDEFQAIAQVDPADAVIRSHIQHHTDQVSYLFAGSELSTLHLLFNDRARPLYGQAEQILLEPFDPRELGRFVETNLRRGGRSITPDALSAYLAIVDGHPQRAMLLADCLWSVVESGSIDRPDLDAALQDALCRCEAEFAGTHALLSLPQRKTLRLLAWAKPLTGAAAQRLGLSQGSARASAAVLVDRGLVAQSGRSYKIIDPLLAIWIRGLGEAV